jgi:hypothetical protein
MKPNRLRERALALLLGCIFVASFAGAAWRPGLMGGMVDGSQTDLSIADFPATSVTNFYLDAHASTNYASAGPIWTTYRTWVYWGRIHLEGTNTFALNIDDRAYLAISNTAVINDLTGTGTTEATGAYAPGWYDFVLRLYNGASAGGPSGNVGVTDSLGFPMGFAMKGEGASEWSYPADDGFMSLFRYEDGLDDNLLVTGQPREIGSFTPGYGMYDGLELDETVAFTVPSGAQMLGDDIRGTCIGYDYYTNYTVLADSGAGLAFTHTHPGVYSHLIWNWDAEFRFTAAAVGGGSVDVAEAWYRLDDTIAATATPDDATTAFVKWSGDVPIAQQYDPVLELTCNGALNVTSHFGKAWYVSTTGSDSNDGLTPATPFATIAKGIASASAGEVVLVDAGNYNVGATMTVDKGIVVRGVAGADQTMVTRTAGSPTIQLSHADAVVEGIHFTKGYSSSVKILAAGGTYRKCIMSGGSFTSGAGLGVNMVAGRLSQCIITNNAGRSGSTGAGLWISGGIAENCLIADNRSAGDGIGGGVYMGGGTTVRNCTIVNNVSGKGGVYAVGGTMENCIVRGNIVQATHTEVVSTSANATFLNCHLPPLPTDNLGVFTDCIFTNTAPNFRDPANGDFRLTLGSPCVDTGRADSAAETGEHDVDGNARLVGARVDIGAYEFDPGEDLTCDVIAPLMEAVGTLDTTLTAAVSGAAPEATLTYAWTTNDVAAGTDATLPLTLANPGYYTIGLTVGDGVATATTIRTNLLYVVPPMLYVDAGNAGEAFPYATPATAAATIQAAVDAAREGAVVMVLPGDYTLASSIMLNKPIELRTQGGPDQTHLYKPGWDVVMLQLGHSQASFHGFDFDGGRPHVVMIWGNGGVVSNCYIRNGFYTSANGMGVRALNGLVTHCLVKGNTCNNSGYGVGLSIEGNTIVQNCLIRDNISTAPLTKGCVYMKGNSILRNCTIVGNQAGNGAGVYTDGGGTVENCIFRDNSNTSSAGPGDPDWYNVGTAAIYRNNCTPVSIGSDCVTAVPNFLDAANGDFRISPGSPCVDAGVEVASFAGSEDYYGNPRLSGEAIDIGVHEVVRTGAGCDIVAEIVEVIEGESVTLTAVTYGFPEEATFTYSWDFDGDDVIDATGISVTHTFPNGLSSVNLTVTDNTTTVSIDKTDFITVAPLNLYVVPVNAGAAYPYDSWETAATNIQHAVDVATDGSTVWVGDGLYPIGSTLSFMKGVTVRGLNGRDAVVIRATTGFRAAYVAHADARLEGLTITGGKFGVLVDRAGGTLYDLIVSNNVYGAGGDQGTGLCLYGGTVRRCLIANNRQTGSSSVAGISIPTVAPNLPVLVENCLIVSNQSTSTGGTVGGVYAQNGTIRNCTIVGNMTARSTYAGGLHATSAATIENCIIMDNANTGAANLANWAGTAASFSYTCTTPTLGGTGNLTDDPRFVNPVAGDFRLQADSTCINAGLTLESMLSDVDLSGGRRVWQRVVDLGALEYVPPPGTVLMLR